MAFILFRYVIFLCFIPIGLANNSSNDFCTWPASINDNNLGRGKFSELIFANKCLSRIKIAKKHLNQNTLIALLSMFHASYSLILNIQQDRRQYLRRAQCNKEEVIAMLEGGAA